MNKLTQNESVADAWATFYVLTLIGCVVQCTIFLLMMAKSPELLDIIMQKGISALNASQASTTIWAFGMFGLHTLNKLLFSRFYTLNVTGLGLVVTFKNKPKSTDSA